MGWLKLDDGFHDAPETQPLSLSAVGLFTVCLSWAHYWRLSNPEGHIPTTRAKMSAPRVWKRLGVELVTSGLWTPDREGRGWYIVDFENYIGGLADREQVLLAGIRSRDRRMFRDVVFERDGHRCITCGSTEDLTLDHVVPLALSIDPRTVDDFATLCRSCNSRKGARI